MASVNCVSLSLGTLFSILSALCFPVLTLLFGKVFKEFIDYNLAVKIIAENLTTHGYYCDLSSSNPMSEYFTFNSRQLLHMRIASLSFVSLAICLLFFIFAALSRSLTSIAAAQIGRRLRHDHFSALLRKTVGWFTDSEEWLSELPRALLLEGIQVIEVGVTFSVILVQKFTMIMASLIIAFIFNWKLALVLSCLLPFLLMFSYFLVKGISFFAEKEQDALMFASSVAEESLQSIETVKLFEGESIEMNRYIHYIVKANKESRKIVMLTVLMLGLLYFFILSFFTIGSWLGFRLMLLCECEASDIILVTSEVVIAAFSISELLPAVGDVVTGFQSASLIKRVASNKKLKVKSYFNNDNGIFLNNFKGRLKFSDVVFSYPATPNINTLNEMNFEIDPGQRIAMVGQSNHGMNAIFRLIAGFYNLEEGSILFDDVNMKHLNIKWLRSQIGFVLYNEMGLFEGSIAENIGYGTEDEVAMDEIIKAAKMANAHEFITNLPFGYTSMVGGVDGITLNHTQIILISLARALIRDPKILIIDLTGFELDKEAEKSIICGINKASIGRTTIIAPYKLSAIQESVDIILMIDNGKVTEAGSHEALMINSQSYQYLYTNRASRKDFYNFLEDELEDREFINNRTVNGITNDSTHGIAKEVTCEDSPLLPKFNHQKNITEDYPPTRTALSLYREILGIVLSKTHWYLLSLALFLFVLAGVALSSFFILFEKLGEHFNNTDATEIAHVSDIYSPLFSILGMVVMFLNCIGYIVLNCCEENLRIGIGKKTFSGLLSKKLKWFLKQNNSVDRLSKMLSTDANKVSQILSIRVGSIAWSVTAVLGALAASFILCWPIGLTLLPSYIWLLIAGYMHCKFTKSYSDYRNSLLNNSTKLATNAMSNIHTVLYFGMAEMFIRKYQESLKEPFKCDMKHAAILGMIYGMSQMLIFLFIGFGYLIGTFLILSSDFSFTYSDILTSLFTIWFASLIFKGRFDVFPGLQDGAISSKKILKYFPNYTNTMRNEKVKRLPNKGQYSLQLANIWDDQTNESSTPPSVLFIDAGQTLAVVSPDLPQDKSVLSIIDHIDSPDPNTLLLDGVDVCELDTKWVWRQIGVVSRYPVLFNMSVMDNIRYGVNYRYISREEVVQVARTAGVHNVLQSLPMGYDTLVGFNGYNLSMGQRFCVALARALIRNPKVLLMDDTLLESENPLVKALERSRKGRTSLVITDKLSTLQQADNVVMLYKGKVLEQGSHSELMEKKKAYYVMKKILQKL